MTNEERLRELYEEYFNTAERANRIPLTYAAWLLMLPANIKE